MKKYLREIKFEDDEAARGAVSGWLEGQSADFYFRALRVCQIDGTNALTLKEIILKNDSICLFVALC